MTETPRNHVKDFRRHLAEDPANRIILAIDSTDLGGITRIKPEVIGRVGLVKVGNSIHNTTDWLTIVRMLDARSARGFYFDARYSENPDQIEGSISTLQSCVSSRRYSDYPKFVSVDLRASDEGLRRAVEVRKDLLIIGETVPPSLTAKQCARRYGRSPTEAVVELASIAAECGLQGVAASPLEMPDLSGNSSLRGLLRIAMGIRGGHESHDDQVRTASITRAIRGGAEMVTLGRRVLELPTNEQSYAIEQAIDEVGLALEMDATD